MRQSRMQLGIGYVVCVRQRRLFRLFLNMGERWNRFRSGTWKTFLAGVLYVISLPAVRNWLMNLLTGRARKGQKVIDVEAKKE